MTTSICLIVCIVCAAVCWLCATFMGWLVLRDTVRPFVRPEPIELNRRAKRGF